ncbi:MAG TPA: response regulator [Anaerolineales bacterium]|nr:response regulator [Anaerolineales bacterium]
MSHYRALLADDHALVRAGIRNALQDLPNLEVVGEIADGKELFQTLAQVTADILLIDVTMPEFEPFSAIQSIRQQYPKMKILVISAHDDDIYVQGLLAAGVNGYHLKDQSLRDLRLAVEQVLAGKRWLSSRLLDKLLQATHTREELPAVSNRQLEMLELLNQGLDNRAIATRLDVSIKTVENHLTRLYRILGVQSRLEAVHYLQKHPKLLQNNPTPYPLASVPPVYPSYNRNNAILIVDDNQRYRTQLSRLISKNYPDLQILEAGDTQSALANANNYTVCLALVDVVLADEDGLRCTRRLKASHPKIRVVLMSAYPDREFHRQGMQAGASAFVDKKDLDIHHLRQIVEDALGS